MQVAKEAAKRQHPSSTPIYEKGSAESTHKVPTSHYMYRNTVHTGIQKKVPRAFHAWPLGTSFSCRSDWAFEHSVFTLRAAQSVNTPWKS